MAKEKSELEMKPPVVIEKEVYVQIPAPEKKAEEAQGASITISEPNQQRESEKR